MVKQICRQYDYAYNVKNMEDGSFQLTEKTADKENTNGSFMSDESILSIKSPKDAVDGPFYVVYKNLQTHWALVALDFHDSPRLAFRYFYENEIWFPSSKGHPVWMQLPDELNGAILDALGIKGMIRKGLDLYLEKKIRGLTLSLFATLVKGHLTSNEEQTIDNELRAAEQGKDPDEVDQAIRAICDKANSRPKNS